MSEAGEEEPSSLGDREGRERLGSVRRKDVWVRVAHGGGM